MRALLAIVLVLFCFGTARADDVGAQRDVTAIRSAVPVLLHRLYYERNYDPSQIVVSDIVVVGDAALANWHIGSHDGIVAMDRIAGTWWDLLEGYSDRTSATPEHPSWWFEGAPPWRALSYNGSYFGPTSARLLSLGLPMHLVATAAAHNPLIASADDAEHRYESTARRTHSGGIVEPNVDREVIYLPANVTQNGSSHGGNRSETGGYEIVLVLAPNDAPAGTRVAIDGSRPRAPAASLYNLTFSFTGSGTVTFGAGSRVNVWFPYILDTRKRYTLSLAGHGSLDADLHDNTLTFALPDFSARPNETFKGSIDAR
ncbi:MAG TPA: hypothetical protein VIG32_03075 [Candidatus Baltobacteraceae bacterium]